MVSGVAGFFNSLLRSPAQLQTRVKVEVIMSMGWNPRIDPLCSPWPASENAALKT